MRPLMFAERGIFDRHLQPVLCEIGAEHFPHIRRMTSMPAPFSRVNFQFDPNRIA
jgi:hypothetical protein